MRLWDVAAHQEIGTPLTGPAGEVMSVAFGPDGKTLASGNLYGTVQLWDVAYLVDLVPDLCAAAGRSLTPAEWAADVGQALAYQRICP